jgi:hypothetical protein
MKKKRLIDDKSRAYNRKTHIKAIIYLGQDETFRLMSKRSLNMGK